MITEPTPPQCTCTDRHSPIAPQAMNVMPDFQEIGKLLGLTWGQTVSEKIIPGIQALQTDLAKAREEAAGLRADKERLDWLIDHEATVMSSLRQKNRRDGLTSANLESGFDVNWEKGDGTECWLGPDNQKPTAREAIDAAKNGGVEGNVLHEKDIAISCKKPGGVA